MEKEQPKGRARLLSAAGLILATIIWGWGFIFVRFSLDAGLSPAAVLLGRFALAALAAGILFRKNIGKFCRKNQWVGGVVVGALLFFASLVQTIGVQHTTPANSAFITGTYVVMVPFLHWAFSKKRPAGIVFLACGLSFAGAAILSVDFSSGGVSVGFGDVLTLFSALLFAAHIVANGHFAKTIHHTVLVFMQMVAAALLSLVLFLVQGANFAQYASLSAAVSMVYLGFFSTFFCFFLQTAGQRHLSPATTGILLALEGMFGALSSVLVGYDSPSVKMVAGGVLMLAAAILPEVWRQRREKVLRR